MKFFCSCVLLCLLLVSGCIFPSQPEITVTYYTLEYQPPLNHMLNPLDASIKIARFSSSQEMNTQAILFSSQKGVQENYNYSRWRAFPADLCADYLARDMRYSQLMAVAPGNGIARFRLEGALDDFLRLDRPEGMKVRLALTCTLLDQENRGNVPDYLLFQRNYVQEIKVEDDSPLTLALAMSQAMAAFSQQVQYDIYMAIQARLMEEKTPERRLSGQNP